LLIFGAVIFVPVFVPEILYSYFEKIVVVGMQRYIFDPNTLPKAKHKK